MSQCPHYQPREVNSNVNCPHCFKWDNPTDPNAKCSIHEELKDVKQIWGKDVMEKFIGFKMIEAEPQMKHREDNNGAEWLEDGYKVVYPDGYTSWSPKEVFEKAHIRVGTNNTITIENVHDFIASVETSKVGEKTTLVVATLVNGYVITESSACVDPSNYNEELGKSICLDKITDKVWMLLGFLLQTAKDGVTR